MSEREPILFLDGRAVRTAVWEDSPDGEGGCYVVQGNTYTDLLDCASVLLKQRDDILAGFKRYGEALAEIARERHYTSAHEAASRFQTVARRAIKMLLN